MARPVLHTLAVRCPVCGALVGHACGCFQRGAGAANCPCRMAPPRRPHVGRARHARLEARLIRRRMGAQVMPSARATLRQGYQIAS